MKTALSCLAVAFALAAGPSLAQTATPAKGALADVCASDVKTYCANVPSGGGALSSCIMKNEAKLSTSCKDAIVKLRQERKGRKS